LLVADSGSFLYLHPLSILTKILNHFIQFFMNQNDSVLADLPLGWKWVKLGEIFKTTSGGTPSRRVSQYYEGQICWVKSGELNQNIILDTEEKISQEAIENSSAKVFPKGTLLIALYGATIGKLAFLGISAATNQAVCGIFDNGKDNSKFLYYYLLLKRPELIKIGTGGAQPNISQDVVKKIDLPLPPLSIQAKIVEKIETLLSELDRGKAQLLTAQAQLKIYRQAVLKYAFEGKLTNENVKEGELPKGWKWVKIDFMLSDKKKGMATGPFGTMLKKHEHQKSGVAVLGIENIGEGVFQMPNKIFITNEKAIELKNFRVIENDVIISRSGTVGEICLLPKKMENSIISTNLIRVRLNLSVINPKFFVFLFEGGKVRQQVFDLCKGSSRAFLNQSILNTLDFPYCSFNEQYLIIQEIESRLSVCDKLEETIKASLLQSESLRQSVLKRAFEGRLL
jgi:type I restriction enzyme, S subunit